MTQHILQGRTEKEQRDFLNKESRDHPNSYKDTKEYKNSSPEKQRETDRLVERNNRALEQLRKEQEEKKK